MPEAGGGPGWWAATMGPLLQRWAPRTRRKARIHRLRTSVFSFNLQASVVNQRLIVRGRPTGWRCFGGLRTFAERTRRCDQPIRAGGGGGTDGSLKSSFTTDIAKLCAVTPLF